MSRNDARARLSCGGRLCLDFANTKRWRLSETPLELIPDYPALLRWSLRRGVLPRASIARLKQHAARTKTAAAEGIARAHSLRELICTSAMQLIAGRRPSLEELNRVMATLPAEPGIARAAPGYVHDLPGSRLEEPLWPILWSFTALLTSEDAHRLGSCRGLGCGWLFVDESPNRTRTWCSSESCGNRERARRSYAKRRSAPAPFK